MANITISANNENRSSVLRIERLSAAGQWVTTLGLGVVTALVLTGGYLLVFEPAQFDRAAASVLVPDNVQARFSAGLRGAVFLILLPVIALAVFWLLRARRLFIVFRRGEILTEETALLFVQIGRALVALMPVSIVIRTLGGLLATLNAGVGNRQLAIGLGSEQLMALVLGLLLVVVGRILKEATRISDDHRLII